MAYWGRRTGLSANGGLLVAGLLLAAVLLLVATSADAANARARTATNYCWRTGPHPSGLAMWSEDGEHWRKP